MLVATRDPMPQHGRHDASAQPNAAAHHGSRIGRLMLLMQLAGSALAIPVGLASGYSIYRANFSPETACQTLRSNIVSMIDKQIDASTRRMLVRRDVEEFEKTCGTVDPDAETAFKALLASGPPPAAAPTTQTVQPLALPAQEWKRPEPAHAMRAPAKEAKEAKETKDVREPAREARVQPSDAAGDARWLDAVRHALTAHQIERAATEATVKPLAPPPVTHLAPVSAAPVTGAPVAVTSEATAIPAPLTTAPAPAAPTLPPPASIGASAPTPSALRADADHPVPPASIPVNEEPATGSVASQTSWTDHIPFFGK
jgi:hypothetical protein